MASTTSLRFGGSNVEFTRSPTQVAVKPAIGRGRNAAFALESVASRSSAERRGRLGTFEIIDIQAPESVVATESVRLGRSAAIQERVPVYHTSDDEVPFVPDGKIFLSFEEGTAESQITDLLTRYDVAIVSSRADRSYTVYSPAVDSDALEVAARFQREAIVAAAEPDLVTPLRLLSFLPEDAMLERQWHLENRGEIDGQIGGLVQGADARVVAAWKQLGNLGDPDAVIAMIDDGFDLSHPDLGEKSVHPWDFRRGNSNVQPQPDLQSPIAGNWHGTACAGVAVGKSGGGEIVGAAPNARFLPVRMGSHLSADEVTKWFDYVTDKGAWVISCSWNAEAQVYPLPNPIQEAITRCATEGRNGKGCVVVFAAGNSGKDVNDPPISQNGFATHPEVLAVAASTSLDRRASYSDTGKEIAVCAPSGGRGGLRITTADATGTYVDANGNEQSSGYEPGPYNTGFTGTSSACPLVAGICSLVLSANPDLTAGDVRQIIKTTARKIGSPADYVNGHSTKFGHGCVDAERAVTKALEARQNANVLAELRVSDRESGST